MPYLTPISYDAAHDGERYAGGTYHAPCGVRDEHDGDVLYASHDAPYGGHDARGGRDVRKSP
jgi:hypothetical protein